MQDFRGIGVGVDLFRHQPLIAEGAGGKLDGGKEADVILGILALAGSKDDGNSGKLEDTLGKEGVKLYRW